MEKLQNKLKTACPDEATLTAYLSGILKEEEKASLEEHIAGCHLCLDNIRAGYAADKLYNEGKLTGASDKLTRKAKGIAEMKDNRKLQRNIWLVLTILAFFLSFTIPKYFAQFLVASLILGLKWVSESESIRTLIIAMEAKRGQSSALPADRCEKDVDTVERMDKRF